MPKEYMSVKRINSQEKKRKQIYNAFFSLLQEKSLDSINVQEICDKAGIHRTTFYNHFYDRYDLLSFGADQILSQIFPEEDVYEFDAENISKNIIRFLVTYRKAFGNIIHTNYQEELRRATQKTFEDYILKIVESNSEKYTTDISAIVMVRFCCGGLTSLLFWWYEDSSVPIDEIEVQIKKIIELVKNSVIKVI